MADYSKYCIDTDNAKEAYKKLEIREIKRELEHLHYTKAYLIRKYNEVVAVTGGKLPQLQGIICDINIRIKCLERRLSALEKE